MKLWQARNTFHQIDLTEILTVSSFSLSIIMHLKILASFLFLTAEKKELNMGNIFHIAFEKAAPAFQRVT